MIQIDDPSERQLQLVGVQLETAKTHAARAHGRSRSQAVRAVRRRAVAARCGQQEAQRDGAHRRCRGSAALKKPRVAGVEISLVNLEDDKRLESARAREDRQLPHEVVMWTVVGVILAAIAAVTGIVAVWPTLLDIIKDW